jgi:signal transduction histidine kinase
MSEERRPRRGIASVAVVAGVLVLVAVVDGWVASATARGTEALSTNALRSVELADDMRWQLSRVVPPRGTGEMDGPTERQALEWLARDVRAYEPLATFEGERPEWLTLAGLTDDLSVDLARGDRTPLRRDASNALESVNRLIGLNRIEAEAIGGRLHELGRRQVLVDMLAGGLVLLVVIQVAGARLRAMARERLAAARSLELVESKNRALESFAARAAHDLRSPLVPIHSLASLIVRAGRDEGDVRLASRIVGSASRMSAVIDAMLTFSRSGLLPRGRTEVRSAVSEALEDLGTVAGGAEVVLQLEETTVACAPEVLGQILRNVMGNALKYRAPERPCRVEVSTRVEASSVTVEVVDNGQGMEPAAARRAFEPFFRGTAEGSGHGLGLAIVDSYVRALGARCSCGPISGGDPGLAPAPRTPRGRRACSTHPCCGLVHEAPKVHPQRISRPVLPGTERPRGQKRAGHDDRCQPRVFTPG